MNKLYQYSHIFLFLCSSLTAVTAQRTICASGVTINVNGSPTNYNLKGSIGDEIFVGDPYIITGTTDLGLVNTLNLTFARHDINRSVSCTTTSSDSLLYRVYKVGDVPPAFTILRLTGGISDIGVCAPPDAFFKDSVVNIDLLPSNACGQYQVDFQNATSAVGLGCADATAIYSATFSVAGALTLTAESMTSSAQCGELVDVLFTVSNSPCDIASLQFSINWDPKQFMYVDNTPENIDGQMPVIGTGDTSMGKLSYTWFDADGPCNTVLPDGTTLLTVQFKALGCNTIEAGLSIASDPLVLEATDCAFNPITINPLSTVEVDIEDDTAPDFTCPANLSLECITPTDYVAAIQTWVDAAPATATDACAGMVPVVHNWDEMTIPALCDSLEVTFTATDSCMNTKTCVQQVYLLDTQLPVITTCAVTRDIEGCSTAAITGPAFSTTPAPSSEAEFEDVTNQGVTSDACGIDSVTYVDVVGMGTCPIVVSRTWTITDACGNSTSCVQTINVDDTANPIISTCPVTRNIEGCGTAAITGPAFSATTASSSEAEFEDITNQGVASDVCGISVVTYVDVATSTCPIVVSRTWTVSDACGNSINCTQTINVDDNVAPTWNQGANALDVTVECSDMAGIAAAQGLAPTASDACDMTLTPAKTAGSFVSGSCTQEGTYTNTWIVSDDCGNQSAVFTQIITITDNTLPIWTTAPGNLDRTVECNNMIALADAQALFPVASDNCDLTVSALNKTSGAFVAGMDCLQEGTYTNTWTVTDDCGNTSTTFTQVITVIDTAAPTWVTLPGALHRTVQCSDAAGLAAAQTLEPVATDNCDLSLQLPVKSAGVLQPNMGCAYTGTITNVWTVADDCGNTSTTFEQVITIIDTTPPIWTSVAGELDRTVECSDLSGLSVAQALTPAAMDNCDMTLTPVKTPGSPVQGAPPCIQAETITNTWTVTDDCGNTSLVYTQVITIVDTQDPTWITMTGALDVTVECSDAAGIMAAQAAVPTALDNCDPNINTQLVKTSGMFAASMLCPQEGTYTNTWTVTDDCGNTSSVFTQVITITDNTAPTAACQNTTIQLDNLGAATLTAAQVDNMSSDLCDATVNLSVLPSSFTCANVGPNSVTLTVTDDCGNTSSCMATVTVEDNADPTITCPTNVIVDMDAGLCTASGVVLGTPTTNDNCSVSSTINDAVEPYALGNTTVTWTVTDGSGNTATCEQTVTVEDNENPTITCPVDVIVDTDAGLCTASSVALGTPTTSDNCTVSGVVNDGTEPYALGSTDIIWTVTDGAGNTATCEQTVTVEDNENPTITCPADVVVDTDAGLCTASGVALGTPTTSDNCSVSGAVNDGTEPYTLGSTDIIWTVTDGSGNTATCEQTVTVEDNENPTITCPADVIVDTDAGLCTASSVALGTPTTSDNCTVSGVVNDGTEPYALGSTDIIWTVTDGSGNTATCEQTVTVEDNENPTITCPADVVVDTDAGLCTASGVALGTPTTSDNCSVSGAVNDGTEPYTLGSTDIIWTVTDGSGNTATCEQTVTVEDNENPVAACPPALFQNNDPDACDAVVIFTLPTSLDNCMGVTSAAVPASGSTFPVGPTTVTVTATDASSNTHICTFVVTVNDTQAPVITCPMAVTLECPADTSAANTGFATATDNCTMMPTITRTNVTAPGLCPQEFTVFRTWMAQDAAGNTATCGQSITVTDNTPPTLACPMDVTVECTSSTLPAATGSAGASDVCDPLVVPGHNDSAPIPGLCPQEYTIIRTWGVADDCGNTAICMQTITVDDSMSPSIACPPAATIECDESIVPGINPALLLATATDNCDNMPAVTYGDQNFAGTCPQEYTIFRTWTAMDACGNSTSCVQSIAVEDNQAPTADPLPALGPFACYADRPAANINDVTGEADNCGMVVTVTYIGDDPNPGCSGTVIRTYRLTDECGNTADITQSISINDNVAPTANPLPAIGPFACYADIPAANVNDVTGEADNCGGAVAITHEGDSPNPGCTGTVLRTYRLEDACGNTADITQIITIDDNVAPTADALPVLGPIACYANIPAANTDDVTGETDNCGGTVTVTHISDSADPGCAGTVIRTYRLEDACGNTADITQSIMINDNVPPTALCQDVPVSLDAMGSASITAAQVNNNSTDNCGGMVMLGVAPGTFTCANVGANVVTLTVTDNCSNSATCTATVTVNDVIPPVAICPADITQSNDMGQCDAVVNFMLPNPTDNCPGASSSAVPASGSTFAAGTTMVTVTATDASSNTHFCTFTVTVTDTELPTITCPADVTVSTDPGICSASGVSLGMPTTGDNCTFTSVVNDAAQPFAIGNTTVTWTVSDGAANTATCEQTVTVNDTQNPVAACPPAQFQNNDPGLCSAVVVFALPASSDNCPGVTSAAVPASGSIFPVGPTTVTVTATDASSNTHACTFIVTVNDTQAPVITCPMSLSLECPADTSVANTGIATATDNCTAMPLITYTNNTAPGLCPQEFTVFRTWMAQDAAGNTATCVQAIAVTDNTPPMLACPSHTTVECTSSTLPATTGFAGASDLCDMTVTPAFTDGVPVPGACPQEYAFVRTWVVVDDCGNSNTCTQSITVDDSTIPTITFCPPPVTIECSDSRVPGTNPALLIATATDNCDASVSISYSDVLAASIGCVSDSVILRTWLATDDCGNTNTCFQSILASDTEPPTWTTPAGDLDETLECDDVIGLAAAQMLFPLALDNCDNDVTNIVKVAGSFVAGLCPEAGTYTNTWTVEDTCGNVSDVFTQIITIVDTQAPTADPLPAIGPFACYADIPAANVNDVTGEADNCGGAVAITHEGDSPNPGCTGTVLRTYRLEDACGNTADITQIITIDDNVAPTADALLPLGTFACYANIPAADINDVTGEADNCGGTVTVTHIGDSADPGCSGTVIRTYRLEDACGNTADITQSISVNDDVMPLALCQDITVELDVDGNASITGSQVNNNSTDNCGGMLTFAVSPNTFTCANVGANAVTLTVTDNCSNSSTCAATVTITLPGGAPSIPTVTLAQSAATICSGDSYTLTLTPGGMNPMGTTYDVSWVITPAFGMPDPNLVTLGGDFGGVSGNGMLSNTTDLDLTGAIDNININSVNVTFTVTPKFGPCPGTPQVIVVLVRPLPQATSIAPIPPAGICSGNSVGGFTIGHNLGTFGADPSNSIVWSWSGTNLTATPPNGTDNGGGSPNALFVSATTLVNTGSTATTATLSVIPQRTTASLTCSGPALEVQIVVEPEPEVVCPNDISATTATSCDTTLTLTHPTLNLNVANCPATMSISFGNGAPAPPALPTGGAVTPGGSDAFTFALGQTVVTYTVVDGAMNATSCSFVVNVTDNDAPSISCPPFITIECNADTIPGSMAPTSIATATDNCGTVSLTHTTVIAPGGFCPQEYVMARTWVAQDAAGNTVSCTQVITVDDSQAPSITCPANLTINCGADTTVMATGFATALDNCSPTPSIGIGYNTTVTPGSCPQEFTMTRLWAAIDNCGNFATCTQTIEVQDTTRPTITCPAGVTIECDASQIPGPGAPTGIATATDNCDNNVHLAYSDLLFSGGSCTYNYIFFRTWTATDDCGNANTCTQPITVEDTTPPTWTSTAGSLDRTIQCNDMTALADAQALAPVVADNCTDTVTNVVKVSGSFVPDMLCPQAGTYTNTWTATDSCGNTGAVFTQTITVADTEAPTWTTAAFALDVTLECSDPSGLATAQAQFPVASDNCDGDVTNLVKVDGPFVPGTLCPQAGTYTNTWTVADTCGNLSLVYTQVITITDNTAPTFTEPADITVYVNANCTYDASIGVTGDVTDEADNCDTNLDATFTDNVADGSCAGSKVITRIWSLSDDCGNSTIHEQIIAVLDTLIPMFPKPDDVTLTTDAGASCPPTFSTSLVEDQVTPVATGTTPFTFTVHGMTQNGPTVYSDNCSSGSDLKLFVWNIEEDFDGNADSCYRQIRVTWRVYDDCGNFRQRQQFFEIIENTPPSITCPAGVTINCEDPQLPAETGMATATDNCDPAPVVASSDIIVAGNCPGNYAIERTWTATDNCGNATTCVQTIAVQDVEAPVLTCPADTVLNCEILLIPVNSGTATATDNCDMMPVVTYNDTPTSGSCAGAQSIERIWSAVDACGNQATPCTQLITVQDTTDPVIICPGDVLVSCENPHTPAQTGTATATDNCDASLVLFHTDVATAGTCPQDSIISRRWIAVDDCGNIGICIQTITVRDLTAPILTCAMPMTIACNADTSAAAIGLPTVTDNCDLTPTIFHSNVITPGGICAQTYTITRMWTAVDDCGNSTNCTQIINVQDIVPPVLVCAPDVTVECDQDLTPGLNNPTGISQATDNCDISPTVLLDDEIILSGTCPQEDTIVRTWVVIDDCANGTACIQTIVVRDRTAPIVTCPVDMIVACELNPIPALTGTATASDNCDMAPSAPVFTDVIVAGQCPQDSVITRTWTSEDACGNVGSCVQTINWRDQTAPIVTVPNTFTIECSTTIPAAATTITEYLDLPGATASDNCSATDSLTVSSTTGQLVGTECNGTIQRTYQITDECGNTTTVTQIITVMDLTAPVITCPADITVDCHESTDPQDTGFATATDNCTTAPVISSVDNIIDGNCPGNYAIARIWTATDDCAISMSCVQTITVLDTIAPSIVCPPNTLIDCDDPQIPANTGTATATDLCDPAPVVTYLDNTISGNCGGNFDLERTWTATDSCGNTATCLQIIALQDTIKPVITCPLSNITVNCEDTTPAFAGTATATDNCDASPMITYSDQSTQTNIGACSDQTYTITRTWLAEDDCGNSATCQQTIMVQDTTRPAIICPLNITINCDVDTIPANTGQPIVQDNCDAMPGVTHLDIVTLGNCPDQFVVRRRWIALDNCANINACEHFITVQDTTKPVLNLPPAVTLHCDADLSPAGQAGFATATDNCADTPTVTYTDNTVAGSCAHSYMIERTWTAEDACGNAITNTQVIIVQDVSAPTMQCPVSITIACNDSTDPNVNTAIGEAIVIDNCDPTPVVTYIDAIAQFGPCMRDSIITRTWSALDNCNNAAACLQTITKRDTIGPVVSCPADATVECDADTSATALGFATALDNCGAASIPTSSDAITAGNCPQEYTIARTWTSVDDCGNAGSCVQTISVDDSILPTFTVPADFTVYTDADCNYDASIAVTGDVSDEDDNCATGLDATFSDATVDGPCTGSKIITRTWSLEDGCGNVLTQNQTITVSDTLIPAFPKPDDVTLSTENGATCPATAEISLTVDQSNPVATGNAPFTYTVHGITIDGPTVYSDNCTDVDDLKLFVWNIQEDFDGNADSCYRQIRVLWRVYDDCGNFRNRQQFFTIIENTAPVITCPAGVTINCEDPQLPAETGTATATDNCDPAPVVSSSDNILSGNCLGNYAIERIWTVTDQCNNSATCVQVIAIQDLEAPVLTCPADTVINCEVDPIPANTGFATASDNCDVSPTIDFSDSTVPGNCPDTRTITRTWTAFDACGNQAIPCTQIIAVQDTTKPVIICPLDLTINCEIATVPANTGTAIATDNCDLSPSITTIDIETAGSCPQEKVINRRWVVLDNCLNANACIQLITVQDTTRPVLTCPQNVTVECDDDLTPAGTGNPTVLDNCDANPTISHLDDVTVSILCPQKRLITRTWTVVDACGNVNTCNQTIVVDDTTAPIIACPNPLTVECDQDLTPGPNAPTGIAIAIDNCDPAPAVVLVNDVPTPTGTCPQERTIERTWAAVDACGNATACVQIIHVVDDTPPAVVCPMDVTVECDADTSATALGFASATDNCGTATVPTRSDTVTLGNCPQEYTIARTWTSVDDCGNIGTCVQTISVDDSVLPTFTVPANITIYADANCGYDANVGITGDVTDEDDNCASGLDATSSDVIAEGQCFGSKIITRTWSLNDGCGNILTQDQVITVLDTLVPIFPKPADTTLTTVNGATCPTTADISLVIDQNNPIATGNAAFTFTVHGITLDGPTIYSDNCSFGDSLKLFVWNIQEDFDGNADSCYRLIRVLWRVYDDCGNFQQRQQRFTILENKAPEITFCPPSLTVNCEDSTLPAATGEATASDNCDPMPVVSYSDVEDPGACPQEKTIVRTWTATDNCGNSTQCSQTITVVDDEAPALVCPPSTTVSCDDTSPAAAGMATATDNCDALPTIEFNDQSTQTNLGLCSDQTYTITRTWTAYDACGNQAISCQQTVFVQDIVAPVITCPADVTVNCEDELNPAINLSLGMATSVDNCDPNPGVTFTDFAMPGNCPNERTILRTWLTVDNCNNPAACTQTIVVEDNTPPAITCPQDTVVNCEIDPTVDVTGVATATDLCDGNPTVTHSDVSTPGACPTLRTIARTWLAEDACGNSTICVQTITVQDTTRPLIVCPANVTIQCDESIDPMLNPNVGTPTLSDNCDQMLASNHIDNPLPPNGCTQIVLRNWVTADDCNNAAACSQVITVTDSQPPTLLGVPDVTVQCNDTLPISMPTVSDNCDVMPTMTYIGEDTLDGQCEDSYLLLRSWSLGDACGNSTIFVQTITVQDTEAPVWTNTPDSITVECDAIPDVSDPEATDLCDGDVTITYNGETRDDSECADFYTLTRSWTATDNCNNSTVHVQVITVQDTQAPVWISMLPGDITVECGQVPDAATLEAEDNCDGDVEVFYGSTSADGVCPVRFIITRTWVAFDNCSNSTVHTQTVTVTDNTAPTAVCADITVELGLNGEVTIAEDTVDNGSSDNCGAVSFLLSQTTFTCDDLGETTVTLTVTDGCGLSSSCTATVFVDENTPPVWVTQPGELDRTVECSDTTELNTAQALAPTATDNCDNDLVPVKSGGDFVPNGNCPPVGTYTNTWTVTDASGNTAVFTQTITVTDTEAPVITCPANLSLECSDQDKAAQIADWLATATANDACAGLLTADNNYDGDSIPPVTCDLTEGLTVFFTAADNCGNSAACSATIYVLDTEGPAINGDCALLDQYGNGSNAASYIVGTSAGAECPEEAEVNLEVGQEISDNYEITVGGIAVPGILGCLTDNCTAAENLTARVVAINESGDACARIFEVRFVIEDACGNEGADTIIYRLEAIDDTAPTFTTPADITVYLDDDCTADLSGAGDVVDEDDNCQTGLQATFTDNQVPGQGASEYIVERTWTLTDGCGNSTAQIQFITVLDTIRPDFGCPSGIEVAPNAAGCTYVVTGTDLDPDDPTDNCGSTTSTYDLDGDTEGSGTGTLDGVAFNEGTTTVTWTVSDGNGNTSTCSFVVVVTQCIQISGTLIWEGDDSDMTGVKQAMVTLSGDASDTDGPTPTSGDYTLIAGGGGNFIVTPEKTSPPADPLNGVSVLDALLVQQYIVGSHTFPDGYKMIAADVNLSNAITTLDASLIRQAILGSPGALAYFLNKPWRFVPTKDTTAYSAGYDPGSDPFAAPIPGTRVLTGVAGDAIGEDFYGIKTGDVNATGNPENKPENLDPLRFRVQDRVLEAGQNIFVPVRISAFDQLAGYQIAFDFETDVLELLSVEAISSPLGLTPANHFGLYKAAEGEIRSAWIDPYGQTIADEMPVFGLRFAVKQSGAKLSEVLRMKPKAISPEAYNMDHQVAGIELEFYEEQTTSTLDPTGTELPGMKLLQNRPNPFTERTTIGFTLDRGCDAQLRILDASGRELYRLNKTYPAGYHEEVILLRDLRATGVLYYELKTPYGTLTKKMTALAP